MIDKRRALMQHTLSAPAGSHRAHRKASVSLLLGPCWVSGGPPCICLFADSNAVIILPQQNLDMLAGRIAELLAQSETLGEAGDIDGAQAAIAQVETLKVQ